MKRFMADRMLGKLAKWLRVLGYDVIYLRKGTAEEIKRGLRQGRVLLTRDRRAQPWRREGRIVIVSSNDPQEQLIEVFRNLELQFSSSALFSRCLLCNRVLRAVDKNDIAAEVPEYVWHTHSRFFRCPQCNRVFWPGSHSVRMRRQLEQVLGSLNNAVS
ncbi:MAG: Mut7-C RNAse domain-containing protein [Deltaproteobacteria bacterium]|nr:Mut7-C RNAse domain-containing protein [Deltaproteobacteria bacterium]MBW2071923.1 Mut7-C RNAse domain-containing protein [Deltaproteobacteria bacterium]